MLIKDVHTLPDDKLLRVLLEARVPEARVPEKAMMPYNVTAPMIVDVVPAVAVGVVAAVIVGVVPAVAVDVVPAVTVDVVAAVAVGEVVVAMGEVVAGVVEDSFRAHFLGRKLTLPQISPHRHSYLHLPLVPMSL